MLSKNAVRRRCAPPAPTMASSTRLRGARDGVDGGADAWPSTGVDDVLDVERGSYGASRGAYTYPQASDEEGSDEELRSSQTDHDNDTEESNPVVVAKENVRRLSDRMRSSSHYAQTMREAGVTTPVSSSCSARSASSFSSSSSSEEGASGPGAKMEPISSRTSSVSTATTAATTQVHVPTKRPGQPQFEGFWQVRSLDDLRPMLDNSTMVMKQRRADPNGGFVSVRILD